MELRAFVKRTGRARGSSSRRIMDCASIILSIAMVLYISGCAIPDSGPPERLDSFLELKTYFADPPVEYSSAPLWVWNDDVTEGEIDKQLTSLKEQGVEAVFIHPRPGLITPYLSDLWFELCNYTVDKAEELEMQVWLYDENSYPSGFAGGHVPAAMPESYNQGQGLSLIRANLLPIDSKDEYALILKKEGDRYIDITDKIEAQSSVDGEFYLFRKSFYESNGWFGGFSYVDLLMPGVTEKFIEITMGGYERGLPGKLGSKVPGIFTDEPNIASPEGKDCIRWTPALFEEFEKRWGYDLKTSLPSLFDEVGDWKKVRHDYYALLLELFIEHWSKPWYEYCERTGFKWTGHYWEHGWPKPGHGGDNMAMYAYHQVPAIDILMNEYREAPNAQFGNARAVKELASAANQMGRQRTLSETYGAGGWDLRFEDMKRIADWQYVLGVNFTDQHLTYITLMGARKRDHPQSFSYHEPWWDFYRVQGDYLRRMSLAMSSGYQVNDVLVLEPTSTAWMYYSSSGSNAKLETIGNSFQSFVQKLEELQVEYDIGSENIIKDYGKAVDGKFIVGQREYSLVVIPPGFENFEAPTARLVEEYLRSGGSILSFVSTPRFIDGSWADRFAFLETNVGDKWYRASYPEEETAMKLLAADDFSVKNPGLITGKLFHHRRMFKDGEVVLFVNTSLEEKSAGSVRMTGASVSELDPVAGVIKPYRARSEEGNVSFGFNLPPAGSLLLYIHTDAQAQPEISEPKLTKRVIPAESGLAMERIAPNTLTLDYCDLETGGRAWKDVYFFQAADRIFKMHGLEGNPWSMAVQYKTNILDMDKFPANSGFRASFFFEVDEEFEAKASLRAVVERPELWSVSVNGTVVTPLPGAWWLDRKFGVFEIGKYVKGGKNYITINASPLTIHSELEPVYILGEFGLMPQEKGWKIIPAKRLHLGDWKAQNLPFYSDGVSYTKKYSLDRADGDHFVRLGNWLGSVASVTVNGRHAGIIGWQPFELDISGFVKSGSNEITVTVYGTLKNLLGPHHFGAVHGRAWPDMFQKAPESQPPGDDYDFIDYGLFEDFTVLSLE